MWLYFVIISLCLITSIGFSEKKFWVWSPSVLLLFTEVAAVLYNLIGGLNIDSVFKGEFGWMYSQVIPLFLAVSLLFSTIIVLIRHYKKRIAGMPQI